MTLEPSRPAAARIIPSPSLPSSHACPSCAATSARIFASIAASPALSMAAPRVHGLMYQALTDAEDAGDLGISQILALLCDDADCLAPCPPRGHCRHLSPSQRSCMKTMSPRHFADD